MRTELELRTMAGGARIFGQIIGDENPDASLALLHSPIIDGVQRKTMRDAIIMSYMKGVADGADYSLGGNIMNKDLSDMVEDALQSVSFEKSSIKPSAERIMQVHPQQEPGMDY